jgi:hypothetical protein
MITLDDVSKEVDRYRTTTFRSLQKPSLVLVYIFDVITK